MLISLQEMEYALQMSSVSSAAESVSGANEKPEMTGDMVALENLLDTYNKISELLLNYGGLLVNDASQMKNAGITMMTMERNLLK